MGEFAGAVAGPFAGPRGIRLLEHDPDLLRHVAAEQADRAREALVVPLVTVPEGEFDAGAVLAVGRHPFGALVLSGLIAREVSVGGQPTLRLLGPGDVLRGAPLEAGLLLAAQVWTASQPSRLAVLDDRFLQAARHWPRLVSALHERGQDGHDATLIQLALSQQPRVEDRLVALFGALAERWGRMTGEGVLIPLALTHEALGRLVGARRPTVTLALKSLAADNRLERRGDGAWRLSETEATAAPAVTPLTSRARPQLVEVAPQPRAPRPVPENPFPALREQARRLEVVNAHLRARTETLVVRSRRMREETQDLLALGRARRAAKAAALVEHVH